MTADDALLGLVRPLDPTTTDTPPAPGSDRYRSILESAMHTDLGPIANGDAPATTLHQPAIGRTPAPRRRAWRLVAACAAATVIAVGGLVVLRADNAPTAQAAVRSAAQAMDEITSLEGELTMSFVGVSDETSRIRVDGNNVDISNDTRYVDRREEHSTFVVLDGMGYETINGQTTTRPVARDEGLAPFGPSSAAVITAALEGSDVTERGTDTIDGVVTTRYDIQLTPASVAALSDLTPSELAWFELECPQDVESMSVWVAEGLVRQIEVTQHQFVSRTRFFNFGADITITAPPGPYASAED